MTSSQRQGHEGEHSTDLRGGTSVETLKSYFEHLFANSRDIMNLFSLTQGKVILLNAAAEKTTGYSLAELQELPIDALYPPAEQPKLHVAFQRLLDTGYSTDKLRMHVRNGELRDIWTRSYIVQREPETICIVHTIDITEENRQRERELRDAKLATLGEASATLAHELKNALQAMQFSLSTLRAQLTKGGVERAVRSLARIERAAAHMDDVICGIERSANKAKPGSSHLSASAAVQNVAFLMQGYLAAKGVALSTDFGEAQPLVWCNRAQLEQILIVLFKNAAQAMSSRPERQLRVSTVVADDGLLVQVSDTGGGMSPQVQAHLFEAFQTSKPTGIGQGLGLATAKQLASENDLDLTFVSQVDVGTIFSLRLPVLKAVDSGRPATTLTGRLILVVTDDPAVVEQTTEALEGAGARVLFSGAAPDGLQLLRIHAVDAVVCDDTMYPVRGKEFVLAAREFYRGPVCMVVSARLAHPGDPLTNIDAVAIKPIEARTFLGAMSALFA